MKIIKKLRNNFNYKTYLDQFENEIEKASQYATIESEIVRKQKWRKINLKTVSTNWALYDPLVSKKKKRTTNEFEYVPEEIKYKIKLIEKAFSQKKVKYGVKNKK